MSWGSCPHCPSDPLLPRPAPGLLPMSSGHDKAGRSGLGWPGVLERSALSAQSPIRPPGGLDAVGSQTCPVLQGRAGTGSWGCLDKCLEPGSLLVPLCQPRRSVQPPPASRPHVLRVCGSASGRTSPCTEGPHLVWKGEPEAGRTRMEGCRGPGACGECARLCVHAALEGGPRPVLGLQEGFPEGAAVSAEPEGGGSFPQAPSGASRWRARPLGP